MIQKICRNQNKLSSISCCCIIILISISFTWYLKYMEIKSIGKGNYKTALAYGVVNYVK